MTDEVDNTTDKAEDAEVQKETIDDLFKEPVQDSKVAETEEKAETEETEEAETKETRTSEEEEAETTSVEEKSVPIKAYTEERRKRQEAEKRAEELESQLKKEPETKVPDPVEDPEGYKNYMEDSRHLDALKVKVSLSRDVMLDLKEDYAEKENVFVELARKNPFLVQQMNASPNPAKFAYQTAVEHLETEKLRDPKYKETLKEEIRKEILAELKAEPAKDKKKSALDVPDLTQATAAGKNSDKTVKEATIDDIMADAPLDKMGSYR